MSTFWKIALGVGCGVLLAFGALFLTCSACAVGVVNEMAEQEAEKMKALGELRFEGVTCDLERDWMYVRGTVRNHGTAAVDFVKIGVDWLDASGLVVDSDFTFLVAGEELRPEAAKSFEVMTKRDSRASTCRYRFQP